MKLIISIPQVLLTMDLIPFALHGADLTNLKLFSHRQHVGVLVRPHLLHLFSRLSKQRSFILTMSPFIYPQTVRTLHMQSTRWSIALTIFKTINVFFPLPLFSKNNHGFLFLLITRLSQCILHFSLTLCFRLSSKKKVSSFIITVLCPKITSLGPMTPLRHQLVCAELWLRPQLSLWYAPLPVNDSI